MTREGDRRRREDVPDGDVDGDDSGVRRLPSFVGECARTWSAAVTPYAPVAHLSGIGARRVDALLGGKGVPSRCEARALDEALHVSTVRFLPPIRSASLTGQRAPEPSAEPRVDVERTIGEWLRKRRATQAGAQKKEPVNVPQKSRCRRLL